MKTFNHLRFKHPGYGTPNESEATMLFKNHTYITVEAVAHPPDGTLLFDLVYAGPPNLVSVTSKVGLTKSEVTVVMKMLQTLG